MRGRLFVIAGFLCALAAPASAAPASVGYEVTIESPGPVVSGVVTIRATVSGGVAEAEFAAFHLREIGPWEENQAIRLERVGEAAFEATLPTDDLPNEGYRLEVRVWGEVPPYDPEDQKTFARAILDLSVDNAPPAPEDLTGVSPATGVRIGWKGVETADRADFIGYRVFQHKGKEKKCPADLSAYRSIELIEDVVYVNQKIRPGEYCFRIAAARTSAVSGEILSAPSPARRVVVIARSDAGGGSVGVTTTGEAVPPPPPALGEGLLEVSDGEFGEDLPYDPQTVTQEIQAERERAAAAAVEAGADPRRLPTLIAGGLVLAVAALLVRRFLSGAPVK